MPPVLAVVYFVVVLYWLLFLVRFAFSAAMMFSRSWVAGPRLAPFLEVLYLLTDPPLWLLRKVIKPFKIGNMVWDFSFVILLLALWALRVYLRADYVGPHM